MMTLIAVYRHYRRDRKAGVGCVVEGVENRVEWCSPRAGSGRDHGDEGEMFRLCTHSPRGKNARN